MSRKYNNSDFIFKLLFIGDSCTGKSSILLKYTENLFQESFVSTVGVDFKIKTLDIGGKRIKLQIWDTAGQERFQTITTSYFRSADAIFLTYDVSNHESFQHVAKWLQQIRANAPDGVVKILIGNKCDKTEMRQVSTERAQRLASDFNLMFCETSAKTGENIDKAFLDVATILMNKENVIANSTNSDPRKSSQSTSLTVNRASFKNSPKPVSKCC